MFMCLCCILRISAFMTTSYRSHTCSTCYLFKAFSNCIWHAWHNIFFIDMNAKRILIRNTKWNSRLWELQQTKPYFLKSFFTQLSILFQKNFAQIFSNYYQIFLQKKFSKLRQTVKNFLRRINQFFHVIFPKYPKWKWR